MNRPFRAVGAGIPWYTVYGNHDGLVQGNFAQNDVFQRVAVGCRKVTHYSREALAQIRPLLEGGVTPEERARIIQHHVRRLPRHLDGAEGAPRPLQDGSERLAPSVPEQAELDPRALHDLGTSAGTRLHRGERCERRRLLLVPARSRSPLRRARHRRGQLELREHRRRAVSLARVAARSRGRRRGARPRLRPPLDRVDVGAELRRPARRRGRSAPAPAPPRARRTSPATSTRTGSSRTAGPEAAVLGDRHRVPPRLAAAGPRDRAGRAGRRRVRDLHHCGRSPGRPARLPGRDGRAGSPRPPRSSASPRSRGSSRSTIRRRRTARTVGPTGAARRADRNTALVIPRP